MTVALILVTIAAIALIIHSWRHRPFVDDTGTVPMTQARREYLWRQRLDAAIGNESEERLMLHAKGAKTKRRMLAELRNRENRKFISGVSVIKRSPLRIAR